MTIDYGHTAQDLYGPDRSERHVALLLPQMTTENAYERVGVQDMTSHVDFSTLATVGEEQGLHVTGFTNQMSFLIGLGAGRISLEMASRKSPSFARRFTWCDRKGWAARSRCSVQHKGMRHADAGRAGVQAIFRIRIWRCNRAA